MQQVRRHKGGRKADGVGQVAALRRSRRCPGLQRVIAVRDPFDPDSRRKTVAGDVIARSERIALSLQDQHRRSQFFEMGRAHLGRLAGRMEGISETDHAVDVQFVGDERGHPAAHRFASDEEPLPAPKFRNNVTPGVQQHRLPVGRAAFSARSPRRHIRKLESDHPNPALAELARDRVHERRIHRPTRSVGENIRLFRGVWTVGQKHLRQAYNHFMRSCLLAVTLLAAVTALAAPPPKMLAPATIPHPMAMYLSELSKEGKQQVTFRAAAIGTRFFLEEPAGVTVYTYDETVGYRKEAFLKGSTLAKAMKKYK